MSKYKMRIKSIYTYPIKSLRGCEVSSLTATSSGVSYDRRFMLQRISDKKHLAVGKNFEMCLFSTELSPASNPTKILVRYGKDHAFPDPNQPVDDEVLEIPLVPDCKSGGLKEVEVDMHSSPAKGYEMPEKYNNWFSQRFGFEVRLIYIGDNRRQVLGNLSPNATTTTSGVNGDSKQANGHASNGWGSSLGSWIGGVTTFLQGENKENGTTEHDAETYKGVDGGIGWADCAPFLVVNSKSLDDISARLADGETMDMTKFRPNIVLEDAYEAFEEDFWAELAVGGDDDDDDDKARIALTSNCARCASINVDYTTGRQGEGDSGAVLKKMQTDRRVDLGMKYSPVFGRYGFLATKGGKPLEVEFNVGDVVTVSKRNTERTRFRWPGISTDK